MRRMLCVGALASLAALLCGCAMGPDFVAPKPDVPAAWARAPAAPVTADRLESARWWDGFGDVELSRLEARALAANLGVRQAVLRIDEARAQRRMAAAGALPQVDAAAGYQNTRISERTATTSLLSALSGGARSGPPGGAAAALPGMKNPFDQYQYGLTGSWELDLFGRIRRQVEAADANTAAAKADARAVRISLMAEVAAVYVALRASQAQRAIAAKAAATARGLSRLAEDARRAGLGNDLDAADAAATAASADAELPPLDQAITQDKDQLALLLAEKPATLDAELDAAGAVPLVPHVVPVGLPSDLARRRPDIQMAEAQLHAAVAQQGVAIASLYPSVSLTGGAGFQASRPAALADWAARYFSVGPSLDLPVFDAGQRRAEVRLEDARAREAALAYAQTVLAALQEAEDAISACGQDQAQHAALEAADDHARQALSLARRRFEAGAVSFRDVLDAEGRLEQADQALARGTAASAADTITLYKALGGGWEAGG